MTAMWSFNRTETQSDSAAVATAASSTLENGSQLVFNPLAPSQGLQLSPTGDVAALHVFDIEPLPEHCCQPEEVYVRAESLIARFCQSEQDEFAFQLDWRLLPGNSECSGIELWASVQTQQLDSHPTMRVSCSAGKAANTVKWQYYLHSDLISGDSAEPSTTGLSTPAAIVARSDNMTGVWLIAPGDQLHIKMESAADSAKQSLQLFGHFMEKGVIRRARLQFHVANQPLEESQISELYQAFVASPLPLTA